MNDPIVADVHRVREQIWSECGGRIEHLAARLKALEQTHAARLVTKEEIQERATKREPTATV